MGIAVWVVQIILALMFVAAGVMKSSQPKEKLVANLAWVEDFSGRTVKGIGILEFLGGVGLVLPALTGILPWLTPLAALGLALTMVGAAITHYRRREYGNIIANAVLFVLSIIVLVGRIDLF